MFAVRRLFLPSSTNFVTLVLKHRRDTLIITCATGLAPFTSSPANIMFAMTYLFSRKFNLGLLQKNTNGQTHQK